MTALRARLEVDGRLAISLDAEPGEVLALVGPNGAGKTTTLRALAGLEPLDAGEVRLGEEILESTERGIRRPPYERRVGMVFADRLLFPHLSALDNVAFGPLVRGTGKAEARRAAAGWLRRFELGDLADRLPTELSTGQAQRVALARALATEPAMLLIDEAMAALDPQVRPAIRTDLAQLLGAYDGICVLVTHDPIDAMILADRVAVLEDGGITQEGPTTQVTADPRTPFAARLSGLNLYRGRAENGILQLADGGTLATADRADGDVYAVFPPSAVAVFVERPRGSPRNVWPVRVTGMEPHGDTLRLTLAGTPSVRADITPAAATDLGLRPGADVWAAVKATEIRTYR